MELISQHTKAIMEGCKDRARERGLRFDRETLEYIVTNRDLVDLSPKNMIPTLYDFWVHDVEVLQERGRYELYPHNPYETVINTRPAISFYNDNNPDWLNVMIFYHVLAHIDFFQNNLFFRRTWDYDFNGQALSDKRLIAALRSEKGRWVDYVLEFARAIDNLVGYFEDLENTESSGRERPRSRMDFYFDVFLQSVRKVQVPEYIREVERFNASIREHGPMAEQVFFADVVKAHPEFEPLYKKHQEKPPTGHRDLIQFLLEHSPFLNREENRWMKSVIHVVRNTSQFFQPQIRTKILNEGWASYWHETLFLEDDRIRGHEVEFARVNSGVTTMPRVGLNPYALGMQLFYYVEEQANRGRLDWQFARLKDAEERKKYDAKRDEGKEAIFRVRETMSDFLFISRFIDQDFTDRHRLFVVNRRLNRSRMVWEYYVKSRRAEDYKDMLSESLYHPPHIEVDPGCVNNGILFLNHRFEGKPLVRDYIGGVLMGLEFLWGGTVQLETSDVIEGPPPKRTDQGEEDSAPREILFQRVRYTMKDRKLSREVL